MGGSTVINWRTHSSRQGMKEKKRKSVLDLQASGSIKDQVGPCAL